VFCAQTLPEDGAHWTRRLDCIPGKCSFDRIYFDYHIVQAELLLFREASRFKSTQHVCHASQGQQPECHRLTHGF
jgi:hypothetical protein